MEVRSDWYNRIDKEINLHKDTLSKKDSKKYKLDLLLRITKRIEDFSSICGECQMFQQDITKLIQDLGYLVQTPNPNKEEGKRYSKTIKNIVKHLQKHHKLVSEGQYIGIGLAVGAGIGVALGAALGNPGIGPAIGVGIGIAIGSYLDKKAKSEGRVI